MPAQSLAIVPAAGRSERFGSAKLLADLRGEPLINHTLRHLVEGGVDRVVVVVAPGSSVVSLPIFADPRLALMTNPDPSRGMFSSIQTGLAAAASDLLLVLPADMPFVRAETIAAVRSRSAEIDRAVVASYQGRRGHPLALPGRLRESLLAADPHGSLKDALSAISVVPDAIDVDDPGVVRDVDTKADLDQVPGFEGSKVREFDHTG